MADTARRHTRSDRGKPTTRPKRRRTVLLFVGGVLILCLAAAGWVGARALMAKSELEAAIPLAGELKSAVAANDTAEISATSSQLHRHASAARELTSDYVWRAAEIVPFVGKNLAAAREVASIVDDLSTNAVGPLTRIATTVDLEGLRPVDGALDLDSLKSSRPAVDQAATALLRAQKDASQVDTAGTLDAISSATDRMRRQIDDLVPPVVALRNAVTLLPAMLGDDEKRNYLFLFQNPAELRSTGGIAGAMALVSTQKGKIELTKQASSSDFPHYSQPITDIPTDTRGLYGDLVGEYVQDVNLTPDFAQSATLAKAMWEQRFGDQVDGVVSIDPVALSYLLKATGPVTTITGDTINADNAVALLLNEVYLRFEQPALQDSFFAAAAQAVFETVSTGDVKPKELIEGLTRAGSEGRILIWNTRPDEQKVLATTTLSGQTLADQLGVFLNDATGAKMDYYLDVKTSMGRTVCRDDGRAYIGVEVTLTNNAPADAATLPTYITGGGNFGVPPGNIRTLVSAYGAVGMTNLGVASGTSRLSAHSATDGGAPVNQISVELEPGQSETFLFGYLSDGPELGVSAPGLRVTPTININETSEMALSCESALW